MSLYHDSCTCNTSLYVPGLIARQLHLTVNRQADVVRIAIGHRHALADAQALAVSRIAKQRIRHPRTAAVDLHVATAAVVLAAIDRHVQCHPRRALQLHAAGQCHLHRAGREGRTRTEIQSAVIRHPAHHQASRRDGRADLKALAGRRPQRQRHAARTEQEQRGTALAAHGIRTSVQQRRCRCTSPPATRPCPPPDRRYSPSAPRQCWSPG